MRVLERFADEHDLRRGFLFNSHMVAIDADSKVHTATLKVMRKESAHQVLWPFRSGNLRIDRIRALHAPHGQQRRIFQGRRRAATFSEM